MRVAPVIKTPAEGNDKKLLVGENRQLCTVILVCDEGPSGWQEHFHELWHFANDAVSAQGSLLSKVGIGGLEQAFNLRGQVS